MSLVISGADTRKTDLRIERDLVEEVRQHLAASRTEYLLAELRCAAVRARLWVNEIDAIGAALRAGWIDPDEAIAAIADSGCLHLLAPAEERA